MGTEAPDPRTFKTWDDAFQYPIPVVRKLSHQLRNNASENREKLRSLVGASYRDLLDTAETIVDMESRMSTVESSLARIGQDCNTRKIERIGRNAARATVQSRHRKEERYMFASQLAVLRACPVVMARLMKNATTLGGREGGGSWLLVAKVLVLSRLLHKALSEGEGVPPIVESLRDKLGSLRARLLRRIDRRLAATGLEGDDKEREGERDALVEAMCAYSLATSSTPSDVLKHFQHVRLKEIMSLLQSKEGLKEHGTKALKLCLQTTLDSQAIFPRRLADALSKLKVQPLAQDPEVRALYELNLDVHERWIGEDARNYTPRPRHDELSCSEAEKLLHAWSKQAIIAFLSGIKASLGTTKDMKEVAELRQELIETWIVNGSRMTGVKSKNVLDDLRETMIGQLESIVRSRTQSLRSVVEDITSTLEEETWDKQAGKEDELSLWNATPTPTSLSNGASAFKTQILNSHQGRDGAVIRITTSFDSWMELVLEVKAIVKNMKETRWDDPFTDDLSGSEDDDDEFGDNSKQNLLSDDDPRLLEEVTQDALGKAMEALGKSFARIVSELAEDEEEDKESRVGKAIFLLRLIREISDRTPKLRLNDKASALPSPFTSAVTRPLHSILATSITHPTTHAYRRSLRQSTKVRSKSHILWEGNPPLPAQPSPSAFRYMRDLEKKMAGCGADLWAADAVGVLKSAALEAVVNAWEADIAGINKLKLAKREKARAETTSEAEMKAKEDTEAGAPDEASSEGKEGQEEADEREKPPAIAEPSPDNDTAEAREEESKYLHALKREKLKQLLFDVLYIQRFLGGEENTLKRLNEAAGIDDGMQRRLNTHAGDYWRKTYLLFALLA